MKLKVEQLAKIEEATIDVKNLTIFVGKNSTNKSYMAHTVYTVNKYLVEFGYALFNNQKESSAVIQEMVTVLNKSFNAHQEVIKNIFFEKDLLANKIAEKSFYFPASRTGFVLAFDEIVSGVLRGQFSGKPSATKMTEPMIDFISNFADIKSGNFDDKLNEPNHDIQKLFEFIEKRIIKGKILEEKSTYNYTQFYLETTHQQKLDLHLSSSANVELLPLIIFLKHFSTLKDKLLVIEEPEAHLHPKAQIEMARLLVMLSNAGAKVLITTHSDYILNEISNCIKLSSASDTKKQAYLERYGLDKDTVISANDVSAYLFKDIKGEKIEVQELTIDKYGIANDNFDDVLDELLERTDEINEMVL
ncbi:MAG: AAA family ATPase [Campylobacterales bacterium]|nr:AAA family ATPase [Campylobacterales bacterium]